MGHPVFRRLVLATLALIAFHGTASAQKAIPDIAGRWLFKTDVLPNKGCVISGEIEFRKAGAPIDYFCTFTSREDCDREPEPTFTEVKQSCIARLVNGEVDIMSKVEAITDGGPAWFKREMQESMAYSPDNFRVHPQGKDLIGTFHSLRKAAVRFWRDQELVS
jgi:hypothetical protein